nr:MAG TPA: hypothetical protein [Caudoviricetes sp.]
MSEYLQKGEDCNCLQVFSLSTIRNYLLMCYR